MKAEKWKILSDKFASQQQQTKEPNELSGKRIKKQSEGRSIMEGITMDSNGNLIQQQVPHFKNGFNSQLLVPTV